MKSMDDVKKEIWRGNLLWEGSRMMLPEHKQAWIEMQQGEDKVDLHGELDQDQWQEIGLVVMDALKHALPVNVRYWKEGYYIDQVCYIYKIDHENKRVRIEYGPSDDSTREWIDMRVIYDVQRI